MPLIPISLSLLLGIYLSVHVPIAWAWGLAPAPVCLLFGFIYLRKKSSRWMEKGFQIALWMSFSLMGMLIYHWGEDLPGNHISGWEGKAGRVLGTAIEDSRTTPYGKKVVLEMSGVAGNGGELSGKVMTYLGAEEQDIRQGERIELDMRFRPLTSKYESYRKYLANKGIFTSAKGKNVVSHGLSQTPLAWGGQLRRDLKSRILTHMPDPEIGGLAVAMLLGDKSQLASEFRESFAASGLSHILAISGLHVGIIFFFLQQLLRFLAFSPAGKRLQSLVAIALLIIYMVMTGCAPAVCRAVLMIGMLEIGKLFFQQTKGMNTLAAAALFLLLLRPAAAFDIGFQLSFAAVSGIMVVAPRIQNWFAARWTWGKDGLVSAASVCLAAQVFTAPLIWFHFGTFPTYFLFANLLLLPLVTFIVNLGFLAMTLIWVPFLNQMLLGMLDFCLWCLTGLSSHIARWPGATVEKISLSDPGFCILLAMVFVGIILTQSKKVVGLIAQFRKKTLTAQLEGA